jgi:hypothetical protein
MKMMHQCFVRQDDAKLHNLFSARHKALIDA